MSGTKGWGEMTAAERDTATAETIGWAGIHTRIVPGIGSLEGQTFPMLMGMAPQGVCYERVPDFTQPAADYNVLVWVRANVTAQTPANQFFAAMDRIWNERSPLGAKLTRPSPEGDDSVYLPPCGRYRPGDYSAALHLATGGAP